MNVSIWKLLNAHLQYSIMYIIIYDLFQNLIQVPAFSIYQSHVALF